MVLYAQVALAPGGLFAWLLVGLIAGFLAGVVMRGGGYGMLGDILVGLVGALIGGFATSLFMAGAVGFWGSIVVAFIGACILIAVVRALGPAGELP